MKYVIIGGCIAAVGAVEGIRSADRQGEITVIDGEKRGAYSRPLISYFLAAPEQNLDINYRSPDFFSKNRVKHIKARAETVNRELKQVLLDNGQVINYDRLLLAAGASPIIPTIPGAREEWVKTFYTMDDIEAINAMLVKGGQAVIIGSGLIGLKSAEALVRRGLSVTVVEKERHILPRILTPTAAGFFSERIAKYGIQYILADELMAILPEHRLILKSGCELEADLVIMAVGTQPRTELAYECGLEIGKGIKVDRQLRTSDKNIFAAGDVIESLNILTGRSETMALLPQAHREGCQAGCSMAGKPGFYQGGIFLNSIKLWGCHISAAGNPDLKEGKILRWQKEDQLLEMFFNENCLVRYIAINLPEITGPLTNTIEKRLMIPAEKWEDFISSRPCLSAVPSVYWQEVRRWNSGGGIKCG